MSDIVISDIGAYRRGRAQADADYRLGANIGDVFPVDSDDSYLAGWIAGWDAAKRRKNS